MKNHYYRLSLRRRLWLSFVLLTVLSIALTGGISYWIAYRSMEQEAFTSNQNTLNKSAQVLNERLRHIMVNAASMTLGEVFKQMLTDVRNRNYSSYYQRLSDLQIPLTQMKLNDPSIHSVLIHTEIGDMYATNDLRNTGVPLESTLFASKIADLKRVTWVESHIDPLFFGDNQVVTLLMEPITDIKEINVENVYVLVNVKENALRNIVADDLPNEANGYYLLSRSTGKPVLKIGSGTEMLPDDPALLKRIQEEDRGFFKYTINKQVHLVNYSRLDAMNDWVMVSIQDQEHLLKQVNQIKTTSLLIMVCGMLIAVLVANGISGFLLRPLNKLQGMMRQVEQNNLDVRFSSKFEDEVTQVGLKFNRMLQQIASLIEEVKAVEGEKRRMEIKALQAQIDPHFLYNTLNTIIWKSVSFQNQEVTDMISSLSLLFQLGLNGGNEMTTLDKELEHVRHYLNLQQQCYKGLFTYEITVEEEALGSLKVAKIILQPLVENSILHGFSEMDEGGWISIVVAQKGDFLVLEVEDNGKGMDARAVRSHVSLKEQEKKSYALSNVYGRLKLLHGASADMQFASEPYRSTRITLTIPIEGETAHDARNQALHN